MPTKVERLDLRVAPRTKNLVGKAAIATGMSVSAFIESTLVERAGEVLAGVTYLSQRDARLLLRILDSEHKPTPSLLRAAQAYKRRISKVAEARHG